MVRNVSAQGRQLPTRHLRPPQPPPASLGSASNAAAAAGDDTRAELLRTQAEIEELRAFMDRMPFKVPLTVPVASLSAGEKQKLELLKQIYLDGQNKASYY